MQGTAPHMTIEENLALAYLRTARIRTLFQPDQQSGEAVLPGPAGPAGYGAGGPDEAARGAAVRRTASGATLLMATLVPPKLLLLDEHTAALDPSTAEGAGLTREIVAEHHITTMMVTHNMKNALELGNRT